MNILIVGSGGREHALAWKVGQNASKVFVAPGNAGTEKEANMMNVNISVENITALIAFAKENNIHLTIIGPEVPLVLGIVDEFEKSGLRCFGPSQAAAQLEGSKTFSKEFLIRHNIPTADYASFTDVQLAYDYLNTVSLPIVIKADGLAAGKGVVIAEDLIFAQETVSDMLAGNKFGDAGSCIVIEEFLVGEEASFIVMADGKNVLPMATSQDHKARDNGDLGPNTGGMGAYSPAPIVNEALHEQVMRTIIQPTIDGMAKDGRPFTGFLYAGLMIDENNNPKVLEFNVRFGDPETQPIMMRLKSNLIDLCDAALDKKLDSVDASWSEQYSLGVVLAAGGYPEQYSSGDEIFDSSIASPTAKVFHAGTKLKDGKEVTAGGRVLCACTLGDDLAEAQLKAYELVDQIKFKNMYYRNDIGFKAL